MEGTDSGSCQVKGGEEPSGSATIVLDSTNSSTQE
jgi:hypothetical protein